MTRENFWLPEKGKRVHTEESVAEGQDFMEERRRERERGEDPLAPKGLVKTSDLLDEGLSPDSLHDWYSKAMTRREREPIYAENFERHFFGAESTDATYAFGDKDRGYLLGAFRQDVFIPTHFAPKTLRSGVDLVRELGESREIPAIMVITPDLRETILKIPSWHLLNVGSFTSSFRGEEVIKEIVYNDHPEVRGLMLDLMADMLPGGH